MLSDLLSRAGGVRSPIWWRLQGVVNLNSVKASINIQGGLGSSGAYNQMCERAIVLGWSSARNQDSRQWTGDGSSAGAGRHYRSQRMSSDSKCWTDKPLSWTMRPRGSLPADTGLPRSLLLPPQLRRATFPSDSTPQVLLGSGRLPGRRFSLAPSLHLANCDSPPTFHQGSPRKPPLACWDLVRRPRCSPRAACAGRAA